MVDLTSHVHGRGDHDRSVASHPIPRRFRRFLDELPLGAELIDSVERMAGALTELTGASASMVVLGTGLPSNPTSGTVLFYVDGRRTTLDDPGAYADVAYQERGSGWAVEPIEGHTEDPGMGFSFTYGGYGITRPGALICWGRELPDVDTLDEVAEDLARWLSARLRHFSLLDRHRVQSEVHLSRRMIHDLNNVRAGLFSNMDYMVEIVTSLQRLNAPTTRLLDSARAHPDLLHLVEEIERVRQDIQLDRIIDEAPEIAQDVAQVRSRMQSLVRRMETFVASSSGMMAEVELEEFLAGIVEELANQERLDPAKVTLECHGSMEVFTFPHLLRRCMEELLLNAVEAVDPSGGRVHLRVERIEDHAVVVVRDDGPGMSSSSLREAVLPFASNKPRRPNGPPRGLGLNVAMHMAQRIGGELEICPLGGGTVISLSLPAPTIDGLEILVLGEVPDEALEVLRGTTTVRLHEHDEIDALGLGRPDLLLVHVSASPDWVLDVVDVLKPRFGELPLLRYGNLELADGFVGDAIDKLEAMLDGDAEERDYLIHEVKRVLSQHMMTIRTGHGEHHPA